MFEQRVSVIATVRNEAGEIGPLVASLRDQSLQPADVVIVDGASTDATWEQLKRCATEWPRLRVIRDETCQWPRSSGPIARGRNVAIQAAQGDVIACVDAGCVYLPDWLERLTEPLRTGDAEYALGGSCLDRNEATVWDWASAPFFGIKARQDTPTKSCTARSMAFTRALWERAGRFPETTFLGEDTVFDQVVRQVTQPAFVNRAKAVYRPRRPLASAVRVLFVYSRYDGALRTRPARLVRALLRCVAELLACGCLRWSVWPLVAVLGMEVWFAMMPDGRDVLAEGPRVIGARLLFSLLVPWVVAGGMVAGTLRGMSGVQGTR